MELSETLLNTMRAVLHKGATAPEIAPQFPGVTTCAINNRLEDLRAFGLVRRDWRGVRMI